MKFTIQDAIAIPIQFPAKPMPDLPRMYFDCKQFQFGDQIFEVDEVTEVLGNVVYNLREPWRDVPGMTLLRNP